MTVAFHLETPIGNFPYLVSSDNYNAIIVPKGTDFSKWQSTFMGTGAFKLKSYTQNVGAQFVANPSHWGGGPYLDGTDFTFYTSQPPQILALQGGQVDVITQFVVQGAQGLLNNSSFTIITLKSSNHRELSMRNDQAPFTDARVRQAVALTMDRTGMVAALLAGKGLLGNDSAFSPVFPSTDTSVPQRTQDIAKAKQLLSAAGHPNGFSTSLVTEIYQEVPALAQVMKANLAKVGINASLKVETQTQYYGKSTVGNSDWLDGTMSLVDYGSRGVPNVFLGSTLTSNGTWNAARFKNPTYDNLVKQFVAAIDLQTQKQLAGKIQNLLLQETPLVIPYFVDGLDGEQVQRPGPQSDVDLADLPRQGIHGVTASAGGTTVTCPGRRTLAEHDQVHLQARRACADHAADPERDRVHPRQPAPGRSGPLHPGSARPGERGQGTGSPVRHR